MHTTGKLQYPLVSSTPVLQRSGSRDGCGLLLCCPLYPEKIVITQPETKKTVNYKKQIIVYRLKACAKENKLHKATLSDRGRLVDQIPCGDS